MGCREMETGKRERKRMRSRNKEKPADGGGGISSERWENSYRRRAVMKRDRNRPADQEMRTDREQSEGNRAPQRPPQPQSGTHSLEEDTRPGVRPQIGVQGIEGRDPEPQPPSPRLLRRGPVWALRGTGGGGVRDLGRLRPRPLCARPRGLHLRLLQWLPPGHDPHGLRR